MTRTLLTLMISAAVLAGCAAQNEAVVDFHTAAAIGDIEALEIHLAKGQEVDEPDPSGGTALIIAALYGQVATVEMLLENEANVAAKNDDGATALHVAAFFGQMATSRLLLENGADVNAENVRGEKPLDTVAGEWNDGLQGLYGALSAALELDLSLDEIKRVRPQMADLLREYSD